MDDLSADLNAALGRTLSPQPPNRPASRHSGGADHRPPAQPDVTQAESTYAEPSPTPLAPPTPPPPPVNPTAVTASRPPSMIKSAWSATLQSADPAATNDHLVPRTERDRLDIIAHATGVSRGAAIISLGICLPILLLTWWFLPVAPIFIWGDFGNVLTFFVTALWLIVFVVATYVFLMIGIGYRALSRRLRSQPVTPTDQGSTLYRGPLPDAPHNPRTQRDT